MLYIPRLLKQIEQVAEVIPTDIGTDLNIRDRVSLAYRRRVVDGLIHILNESQLFHANKGDLTENNLNEDDLTETLITRLEYFLKDNWSLINETCLSYTVLQNDVSLLLFNIAENILQFRKKRGLVSLSLLDLLMPSLSLESLVPTDYPHLTFETSENLIQFLKFSLLGNKGLYSIPANLLLKLNEHAPQDRIKNYYFDYDKHPSKHAYLDDFEIGKLIHQSKEAEEYFNAIIEYNQLLKEEDSLYSRLEILWKHLYYNSKNIAGKEEIAGEGIYTNLINFIYYYESLSKGLLKKISQEVKNEIELLKQVASKDSGIRSCLANRQESLRKVLQEKEDELKKITRTQNKQEDFLGVLKERIKETRKNFESVLKAKDYECVDRLGLTYQLVKKLGINFQFSGPEDLFNFITILTPEEIKSFGQDSGMRSKILSGINQIDDLIVLISTGLSDWQLESFISIIKTKLINKENSKSLIKKPEELLALLIFLNGKQVEIVLNILKPKLSQIIFSSFVLSDILTPLSSESCAVLCKIFKEELLRIFGSNEDLRIVFSKLSINQKIVLFDSIKFKLPKIIKSAKELHFTLNAISSDSYDEILHILKSDIPKLIQSASDFTLIENNLNKSQKLIILIALEKQLFKILSKSTIDFCTFFCILKENDKHLPPKLLSKCLPKIIFSAKDFNLVFQLLSKSQQTKTYNLFKNQLHHFIHSAEDFCYLITVLDKPKRKEIFEKGINCLPEIISSPTIFISFFSILNENERSKAYSKLKPHLSDMIKSGSDFFKVVSLLNSCHKKEIYLGLKDRLNELIVSAEDFSSVFKFLEGAQLPGAYESLKNSLPEKIRSIRDFCNIYCVLNKVQQDEIFKLSKQRLVKFIRSKADFELLGDNLSINHIESFCKYFASDTKEKEMFHKFYGHKSLSSLSLFGWEHLINSRKAPKISSSLALD